MLRVVDLNLLCFEKKHPRVLSYSIGKGMIDAVI